MELSVLDIECELEQDDFVVIFKAFYEGYISKSDKYYPPRCSIITQKTCSSLAGAKKITQKSRSDLSTLDFLILFYHEKSIEEVMNIDQDGEFFFSLFLGPLGAWMDAACWAGASAASGDLLWQTSNNLLTKGFDFSRWNYDWQGIGNTFTRSALLGGLNSFYSSNINLGNGWGLDAIEAGTSYGLSNVTYAGLMGEDISGNNFWNQFGSGFAIGATSSLANSLYESQVGYGPNPRPGNGVLKERGEGVNAVEGYNVWGNPVGNQPSGIGDLFINDVFPGREGGFFSSIANLIPGQNAFAQLHDNWSINGFWALTSIPFAQYITYNSLLTKGR